MIDVIKSYLVSLGFAVDQQSYNQATKAMDSAEQSVAKFAGSAVTKFAVAGAAVTSFVAAASIGIAKFIGDLAQADLANEKLARQMWTSKDQAAAFNSTLKAMGAELKDLYLSPELMHNFQALRQQAGNMRAPQEFGDMMKMIRSIQFEFTRMKLEATYALQWVGYYLIKYMGGPIKDIKKTLGDINNTIVRTMPAWTKVVAQVMSWFARMGIVTVRAITDIIRVFDDVGDKIPKNMRLIGGAIAALAVIIQTGPVGMLIAGFTTLILLLDDFYTYLDGGESKFGPFWKKLIDFYDQLKGSGAIEEFKKGFEDALQAISKGIDETKKGFVGFYDDLEKNGTLDNLEKTFSNTFDIIEKIIAGGKVWVEDFWKQLGEQGTLTDLKDNFEKVIASVSQLSEAVTRVTNKILGMGETQKTLEGIGKVLTDVILFAFESINRATQGISDSVKIISKIIGGGFLKSAEQAGKGAEERLDQKPKQGFFASMLKDLNDMLTNSNQDVRDKVFRAAGLMSQNLSPKTAPSYVYPSSNTQNTNTNTNSVSLQQTNNIYGSDPNATAGAVVNNTKSLLTRNMQGVIQ